MKTFGKALVAGSLLLACGVAAADVAYNVAVTTDYRFRGVSQSAKDPAIQGGVDFSDKSGFYLGAWASTIDFGTLDRSADLEVDLYGGYKWKAANVEWDVGLIHYAYPGSSSGTDLPFTEVYVGGTYGPVSAKYFYTNDFTGTTDKGAHYITASGNIDLGSGFTLGLSIGHSRGGGVKDPLAFGSTYTDYKIGVSKEFSGVKFDLSYVDTSGLSGFTNDLFNAEGVVVLTVSKTF